MARQDRQAAQSAAKSPAEAGHAALVAPVRVPETSPPPENDNEAATAGLSAEVRIAADLPILPIEIEVIAALLDDLDLGNENEG